MILKGGPNTYGAEIGIMVLESYYYKVPAHIKNHHTFDFPVVYKVIDGATPAVVVRDKCADLLPRFIAAAKELEAMDEVLGAPGNAGEYLNTELGKKRNQSYRKRSKNYLLALKKGKVT